MTHLKRTAVFLLHLGTSALVQYSLLRLIIRENEASLTAVLAYMLPALVLCLADLILSVILLRDGRPGRYVSMALHFWDLVLIFPILILGIFGILSGGSGTSFAACVLLIDLLLVTERSTAFVLLDPTRKT